MKKKSTLTNIFVPATHEDPSNPATLKCVLYQKRDFTPGSILQMVNLAKLLPRKSFTPHYHEDMDEIFIILNGSAVMHIGNKIVRLKKWESIIVPMGKTHSMTNVSDKQIEYLVFGLSLNRNGRTVIVK